MPQVRVLRAELRRMLMDAGLVRAWALELRTRRGWRCSERDAQTRALQMLSEYGAHRALDIDDALLGVRMAGHDPGIAQAFAEAAVAGREAALERELAELRAERPRVAKVHPRTRADSRGRGAA